MKVFKKEKEKSIETKKGEMSKNEQPNQKQHRPEVCNLSQPHQKSNGRTKRRDVFRLQEGKASPELP